MRDALPLKSWRIKKGRIRQFSADRGGFLLFGEKCTGLSPVTSASPGKDETGKVYSIGNREERFKEGL